MSDFNINAAFNKLATNLDNQSAKLNDAMNKMGEAEELSDQDMLKLQFQINQYNAMLEAASAMTKALVDEAKNLAQRAS